MPAATAQLTSGKEKATPTYRVSAIEPGPAGNEISVEVAPSTETAENTFKIVVNQGGKAVETFDNLTTSKGKNNVVTQVKAQSKLIQLEEIGTASAVERVPGPGSISLAGGGASVAVRVTPDDYVGNAADRTGFGGLEAVDEVTMLARPDLMAVYQQGAIDLEGVQAVQLAMIAHCELMGDRVAILDPPPGLNAQQIKEWRVDKAGYDSKYATLYWPWIKVFDPLAGQESFVPPSGHMAGIWARNDDTRGVHKAPANEVDPRRDHARAQITKGEHDLLNPVGINCIRAFPGRGIRVWGARTLSSDPAWRYLNVRRLFNYVEESILEGTQWVVFEPNDDAPVGPGQAHDQRLPGQRVARGRAVRRHAGRGVLRQVRRGDQPARGRRRRPGGRRDRDRAGQAGRVRHLPAVPVLRRRQPSASSQEDQAKANRRSTDSGLPSLPTTRLRRTTSPSRSTASRSPSSPSSAASPRRST